MTKKEEEYMSILHSLLGKAIFILVMDTNHKNVEEGNKLFDKLKYEKKERGII